MIRALVQARMTSSRFPGKVLAPMLGRPLIDHVLDRVGCAVPADGVTVLTSSDPTDDPLVCHLRERGADVHRGPLDDVVARFRGALETRPCEWFFRVCGDSPLLEPALFARLEAQVGPGVDLVTNVFPRTFPHGHSLELVRAEAFAALDPQALTAGQREHVTQAFYDEPARWRIVNVEAGPGEAGAPDVAVDTLGDLVRVEAILRGIPR